MGYHLLRGIFIENFSERLKAYLKVIFIMENFAI